jgi:hypothetical protein
MHLGVIVIDIYEHTLRHIQIWIDGRTDRQTDRQIGRWRNGYTYTYGHINMGKFMRGG